MRLWLAQGARGETSFRRYHIVSDSDLREGAIKLDQRRKTAETTLEPAVGNSSEADCSRAPRSDELELGAGTELAPLQSVETSLHHPARLSLLVQFKTLPQYGVESAFLH